MRLWSKTIEKAFRSETVDIKTAEQVAIALGCKVDDAFDVETIAKPMTRKSMREYALFIRSTLEYADENYGVKNPMHKIPALGSREQVGRLLLRSTRSSSFRTP